MKVKKYSDYFNYRELLKRCPSHRMLAIRRGEAEGILRVGLEVEEKQVLENLERIFVKKDNESAMQVRMAVKDSFRRLLFPSIEIEYMALSKQKADDEAICVFAENLRQLLLAPPLGNKRVLGIDPGFRTGCKVVCLDETGKLLHNEIYILILPNKSRSRLLLSLCIWWRCMIYRRLLSETGLLVERQKLLCRICVLDGNYKCLW